MQDNNLLFKPSDLWLLQQRKGTQIPIWFCNGIFKVSLFLQSGENILLCPQIWEHPLSVSFSCHEFQSHLYILLQSHTTDGRVCRNAYHILQEFSLWHIEIIIKSFIFWWGVQHISWLSLNFAFSSHIFCTFEQLKFASFNKRKNENLW